MKHPYHYLFVLFLLVNTSSLVSAQAVPVKKDTVYAIYCYGTLQNGQPVVNSIVCKNLDFLKDLKSVRNEDKFLCSLFKHSIVYMGDLVSVFKHKTEYNYQTHAEGDSLQAKLERQILSLNKIYKDFRTQKFSNNKTLAFSIGKFAGEFWLDNIDPNYIAGESETFTIRKECYSYNYLYYLKQVDEVYELDQEDIDKITVVLAPDKKH